MKKFVITLALLACLAELVLTAPNARAESSDEEEKKYRLPTDVKPKSYKITLTMAKEAPKPSKSLSTKFTGIVEIEVETDIGLETPNKSKEIRLHRSLEMKINKVTYCENQILPSEPPTGGNRADEEIPYDKDAEIMTINIKDIDCTTTTPSNSKKLVIEYEGQLYNDMNGFYISKFPDYTDPATKKDYTFATTQFQPTHARRAFPCFDEPSFKAKFDITIEHPNEYTAKSNQPGTTGTCDGTAPVCTTTFKQTPTMSTYLIAFIVYPNAAIECEDVVKDANLLIGNKMQVCAPKHLMESTDYALKKTEAILDNLNKFTKIEYEKMNEGVPSELNKMDELNQIAIPDFAAGAMENWGLVTYRETALLHDSKESTGRDKQRISSVIAHEFAHMWFGNLVTLNWWSSTWLNEGFATYFEYHVINELETNWRMADQFVIEQMHSIFQQDVTGALALTSDVNTQSGIQAKFGSISYNKGACIIRMLERALYDPECADDNCKYFEKGINKYLSEKKYGNTEPKDLFKHFETSTTSVLKGKVVDFMKLWTEQPGYPVVKVSIKDKKLQFEQEQFKYASNDESKNKWIIPISYYLEKDEKKTVTILLEKEKVVESTELTEAQAKEFVVVNVDQTGYYRVHYEKDLMTKLAVGLGSTNFGDISEINRAQIVDDIFNLARVGKVDYMDAFNTVSFLEKDKSYFSWYAAFNGFSYLRRRFPEGDLKKNITGTLKTFMKTVYADVNFEPPQEPVPDQIDLYRKVLVLQWACEISLDKCRDDALKIFNENEGKEEAKAAGSTQADLRKIVYCEAARKSTANWDKIWQLFLATDSAAKKVTIITALGCSEDTTKLRTYLDWSINPESGIRSQDANSVFTSVLTGSQKGVDVALTFLIEKYEEIRNNYKGMNALSRVITSTADRVTTAIQIKRFKDFLNAKENELEDAKDIIPAAKATVDANQEWVNKYEDILKKKYGYVSAGNHLVSFSVSALFFLALSINYFL